MHDEVPRRITEIFILEHAIFTKRALLVFAFNEQISQLHLLAFELRLSTYCYSTLVNHKHILFRRALCTFGRVLGRV